MVTRFGRQLVGCISFKHKKWQEGLCISYRNSYDKSLSIGACVGISHPEWNSFAFKGNVVAFKKHTQNILSSLEDTLIVAIYRASEGFSELLRDLEKFKKVKLDNDEAFKFLGLLYGHDILSPRQFTNAVASWKTSEVNSEVLKSLYCLYGICSTALKTSPANIFLDNYVNLHNKFMEI